MALKLANNATTILSAATTAGATTLIVVNTTRFPTLTGADYTYATLVSLSAGFDSFGNPNSFEIIKINGPFTPGATSLNVTRGQDGTTGLAFAPGDVVDLRANRAALIEAAAAATVSSVTANDTTLTIAPTTGAVLAALNLSNPNTWLATQGITAALPTWRLETTSTSASLTVGTGAYTLAFNTAGIGFGLGLHTTGYNNPGTPFLPSQTTFEAYGAGGMAIGSWAASADTVFFAGNGGGSARESFRIKATGTTLFVAGSATAGTAPIKFTSGTLMGTPEVGAFEFLTDKAYITITSGAARKEFTLNDSALTAGRIPVTFTNGRLIDDSSLLYDTTNDRLNIGGVSTAGNDIFLSKSNNGQVAIASTNTSNGTGAYGGFVANNDAAANAVMFKLSSGYTTAGLLVAGMTYMVSSAGAVIFGTSGAADIIGVTGGTGTTNERWRADSLGNFSIGNAALATGATDGFLYISTSAGPPTGAATAKTGRAPIHIDTTNNVFYFRSGGAWRPVPSITYPANTTTFLRGDGTFTNTLTGAIATLGATFTGNVVMSGDIQITTLRRITWDWLNDGTSGAAKTIDWSSYLKHKLQATANCTITFTAPATTDAEIALVVQGDGSLRTFTWPGSVVWENGSVPTMPTATDDFLEVRGRYSSTGPAYYLTWGRFGY